MSKTTIVLDKLEPWQQKAHTIIAQMCMASWRKANLLPNGLLRKRHVPYSVPETAQRLVRALGENNEEEAKRIFLYDYDVEVLSRKGGT